MRRLWSAVPFTLFFGSALAAQVSHDWRSCTPTAFSEQSGIPVAAAYLDVAEGLALGRDGASAPFVGSLQGLVLWSLDPMTRRWAIGPLLGLTYANPRLHALMGGRVRYRVLPFRIHDQTDLGLGLDVFADLGWETPSAALVGVGSSVDLPLDVVLPVAGSRVGVRLLRDTERDDWRLELGLGIRPWRRLATNPRTPLESERWRSAISSVQGAVEAGVVVPVVSPDGSSTVPLCDYTQLRAVDSVLTALRDVAARRESAITSDSIVERFGAAGLTTIVAQLKHPANSWRQQLASARAAPPPMTESAAIAHIAERVRVTIARRYLLPSSR